MFCFGTRAPHSLDYSRNNGDDDNFDTHAVKKVSWSALMLRWWSRVSWHVPGSLSRDDGRPHDHAMSSRRSCNRIFRTRHLKVRIPRALRAISILHYLFAYLAIISYYVGAPGPGCVFARGASVPKSIPQAQAHSPSLECCESIIRVFRSNHDIAGALKKMRAKFENQTASSNCLACKRIWARLETTECRFIKGKHGIGVVSPTQVKRILDALKRARQLKILGATDVLGVVKTQLMPTSSSSSTTTTTSSLARVADELVQASKICWRSAEAHALLARVHAHQYVDALQTKGALVATAAAGRLFVHARRAVVLRPQAGELLALMAAATAVSPGQPWVSACPAARFFLRQCVKFDPEHADCVRLSRVLSAVCADVDRLLAAAQAGDRASAYAATVRMAWALQASRARQIAHFAAAEENAMRMLCAHAVAGALSPSDAAWMANTTHTDGAGACAAASTHTPSASTALADALLQAARAALAAHAAHAAASRAGSQGDASALIERARAMLWRDIAEQHASQIESLWRLASGAETSEQWDPQPMDAAQIAEALPRLMFARFSNAIVHDESALWVAGPVDLPLLEAYVAHVDEDGEVTEAASALTGLLVHTYQHIRETDMSLSSSLPNDWSLVGTDLKAARDVMPVDSKDVDARTSALRNFLKRAFRRRALELHPDKARLLLERMSSETNRNDVGENGILSASLGAVVVQAGHGAGVDEDAVDQAYDIARKAYERLMNEGMELIGDEEEGDGNGASQKRDRNIKLGGGDKPSDKDNVDEKDIANEEQNDEEPKKKEWAFSYDKRDVDEDGYADGEWVDPQTGERHEGREKTVADPDDNDEYLDEDKHAAAEKARKRAAARHRVRGLPPHCMVEHDVEGEVPKAGSLVRRHTQARPICIDGSVFVGFKAAQQPVASASSPSVLAPDKQQPPPVVVGRRPPPVVVGGGPSRSAAQSSTKSPPSDKPKGFRMPLLPGASNVTATNGTNLDIQLELAANPLGLAWMTLTLRTPLSVHLPVPFESAVMTEKSGDTAESAVVRRLLDESNGQESSTDTACAARAIANLEMAVMQFLGEAQSAPTKLSEPSATLARLMTAAGIGLSEWPKLLRHAFVMHAPASWRATHSALLSTSSQSVRGIDHVEAVRAYRLLVGAAAAAHGAKDRRVELLENFAGDAAERLWSAGEAFASCIAAHVVTDIVTSREGQNKISATRPIEGSDETDMLLARASWTGYISPDNVASAIRRSAASSQMDDAELLPIPPNAALTFESKTLLPDRVTVDSELASKSRGVQVIVRLDAVSDAGIMLADDASNTSSLELVSHNLEFTPSALDEDTSDESVRARSRSTWRTWRMDLPRSWLHRRVRDFVVHVDVFVQSAKVSDTSSNASAHRHSADVASALALVRASWRDPMRTHDDATDNDGSPAGRGMVGLGPIAAFRNLRVVNSAGRTLQVLVPNSVQLSGSGGDVGV